MVVDLEDGRLRKGYQILWMDKKSKSNNSNDFYLAKEFDTLSFASVFCFLLLKRNGLFLLELFFCGHFLDLIFEDA
jgi:hypothetical protein